MSKEFLIFKAGVYPQGDYSKKEVIDDFVNRFNANKQRMPVFIGHKSSWKISSDDDELAHGEIVELRANTRGEIWAIDYWFDDFVIERIAKRQLLNCSPEIYGDPQEKIDILGLALLGRTPPANPSAVLPLNFNKDSIKSDFIGCFKLERRLMIFSKNKYNKGDKPMTEEEKKMFSQMQEDFKSLNNSFSEAKKKIEQLENEKSAFAKEKETILKEKNEAESKAFFLKLQDEGKITPAIFEKAVNIDSKMRDDEKTAFRELFSSLNPIVGLGNHILKKKDNISGDFSVEKIRLFQKEHNIESFEDAAILFYKGDENGK